MGTFFIIVKAIGDFILPTIGIVVGLCAISKSLSKKIHKVETAIKASPWAIRLFGVSLIFLSVSYVVAVVQIQVSQSREQSPVYKRQLELRHDAKQLAKDIIEYADDYTKNPKAHFDELTDVGFKITDAIASFRKEGLDTKNISQLWEKIRSDVVTWNSLKPIAEKIDNLANQLPKSE